MLWTEADILLIAQQVKGFKTCQRDAQGQECIESGTGIFFGWTDEDIQVIGGTRIAMRIYRNSANNSELNIGGEKRGEE